MVVMITIKIKKKYSDSGNFNQLIDQKIRKITKNYEKLQKTTKNYENRRWCKDTAWIWTGLIACFPWKPNSHASFASLASTCGSLKLMHTISAWKY